MSVLPAVHRVCVVNRRGWAAHAQLVDQVEVWTAVCAFNAFESVEIGLSLRAVLYGRIACFVAVVIVDELVLGIAAVNQAG